MSDNYQAVFDAVRSSFGRCDVGGAVADAARQAFDISYTVPVIAQEISLAAEYVRQAGQEAQRPSVLMRPSLTIDGDHWCALYGEDLQSGVAGFGKSPAEAMADFDKSWQENLQ